VGSSALDGRSHSVSSAGGKRIGVYGVTTDDDDVQMRVLLTFTSCLLLSLGTGCATAPETWVNPVGDGLIIGDPFALRTADGYFLFGTTDQREGFRCYASDDLVRWREIGFAWRREEGCWATPPFWAPEVVEYRGLYYMTYSGGHAETKRLLTALAVSDRPEGPYRDLHAPWFDPGYSVIDAHIFVDRDGRPWLYFSRNQMEGDASVGMIYGAALRPDFSGPEAEPVKLMEADQVWERIDYANNRCNEGPFVLEHAGLYYLVYAANHTFRPGYGIGYAVADHPLGPFVKAEENPIAGTNLEVGYSGAGHPSITRSPDGTELFLVYHTHEDTADPGNQRRTVNIDRLRFTADGKLVVDGPTRSPQRLPSAGD
jgi:beta-xylosidase